MSKIPVIPDGPKGRSGTQGSAHAFWVPALRPAFAGLRPG